MSKQYKIKRSKSTDLMIYKARPRIISIVLGTAAVAGLVYLGVLIYRPIYDAVMNWGSVREESSAPPVEEPDPQPEDIAVIPDASKVAFGKLRAVYLPPELLASETRRDGFLDALPAEINAVMVDIKDQSGKVLFRTENERAKAWGAVAGDAFDLEKLSETLEARGFAMIARMSAFKDETAARGNLSGAVNYRAAGTTWLDDFPDAGGKPWLNPYSAAAQDYLIELSDEAAQAGAVMIVVNDFQFPPRSLTGDAFFGETNGVSRTQCLAEFAKRWTDELSDKKARLAVYIPVSAMMQPDLTLYGGEAADILADTVLLGALPYQFTDNYQAGSLKLPKPTENPASTVKQAVSSALELTGAQALALIQGGNEPEGPAVYKQTQIADQIDALKDMGIEEYVLYCTDPDGYLLAG